MALRYLEIIKKGRCTYGHTDGFLYTVSDNQGDVKYWKCRRKTTCNARLVTVASGHNVLIRKGGEANAHNHAPNPEEVQALRLLSSVKRAATEHPERPPSAVMRLIQEADPAIQAHLPNQENIKKGIQRERLRDMPANPTKIQDLKEIPAAFRSTIAGDNFIIYDSYEDEDYGLGYRIIVLGTRNNLELLFKSDIWYVDGTFQVVPSIFFQLFTIMGTITQIHKGTERQIPKPFVYALLENKTQDSYSKVLEVTLSAAENSGIRIQHPQTVLSDFELAIINAVKIHFSVNTVRLCLFHLCQSVYRRIQSDGLQQQYMDENDRSIREAAQSMCALAFVPPEHVPDIFDQLYNEMSDDFLPTADYFELTYVRGRKARGRRKAVEPRYPPTLWNHYHSVLQGSARTNNASEGWHNRFQILVGRHHPSIYSFLKELQKEQADVEYSIRELALGKKIKSLPKSSMQLREEKIFNIVTQYSQYHEEENELNYIKAIGYYLNL